MDIICLSKNTQTFLDDAPVPFDANGMFEARCSVCFTDTKDCLPVSYQVILDIYKELKLPPRVHAVCQNCLTKKDKKDLYINLMDYFVTHEIWRWSCGPKDGIIQSNEEFRVFLEMAHLRGTLYREGKRIRQYHLKHDRTAQKDYLESLLKQRTTDYKPNLIYQNLFNKLYEG